MGAIIHLMLAKKPSRRENLMAHYWAKVKSAPIQKSTK